MKKCFLALGFLALSACSTLPRATLNAATTLPPPAQYQVSDATGQQMLVVSAPNGERWRWLALNPLGAPIATQSYIFATQQWQRDGFSPPNPRVRVLFTALMLLARPALFATISARPTGYFWHGKAWLTVTGDAQTGWQLQHAGERWQVKALSGGQHE